MHPVQLVAPRELGSLSLIPARTRSSISSSSEGGRSLRPMFESVPGDEVGGMLDSNRPETIAPNIDAAWTGATPELPGNQGGFSVRY